MTAALRAKLYLLKKYPPSEYAQSFALGEAVVCLSVRGGALYIESIHTKRAARGKGHGQRALGVVLAACDEFGCDCRLEVRPFAGGRSENKLRLWYEKNGFYATRGQYMKRKPKGK